MRHQLAQVVMATALFLTASWVNDWLFRRIEFAAGINWVYLPAGMRLICTLLFAEAGALGLLLASWFVSAAYFFPDDPQRAFVGGIVSTLAPYGVYRASRHFWGLDAGLRNLTPARLLVLALACSVANPLLHHLWFAWRGQPDLLGSFIAMVIGDLNGTLLVLYLIKGLLALAPRRAG
jgi:hypothetical protein